MRITVFGSSGRTGQLFLDKALNKGHTVVAYARSPEKVMIRHERLQVLKGTISEQNRIEEAVKDADAVIELMGAVSEGTERIISAMKRQKVQRLIAASAISVYDSSDSFDIKRLLLITLVKSIIPRNVKEVRRAAKMIRESELDWTLVRIPVLNDKTGASGIQMGNYGRGEVGIHLSRNDLADFLINQLTDSRFIKEAPAISSVQ